MPVTSSELLQYWAVVRRWWYLIVAVGIVGTLFALGFSLRTVPVYRATSTILVQQATNGTRAVDYISTPPNTLLTSTYAQFLVSRPVLEDTLKRLNLENALSPESLKASIRVYPVQNTPFLRVQVEDTDPGRAVQLANTLPLAFSDYIRKVQTQRFQASKQDLQVQIQRLETEIARLQARIDEERWISGSGSPNIVPLQAQLTTLQASYADLYRQYEEVRLAEARAQDIIVLTEPALSAGRVRPRTISNVLRALIVGLILGTGLAFLIEHFNDTIKAPHDIAAIADIPVLASIAQVRDEGDLPLIAHTQPRSPVSEAFRALRTGIQFAGVDAPLRTLVVTSPGLGEGKSFVTANLGIVFAQMGHRVIIVDTDLRKPTQHKFFGLPGNVGLTNVLPGNADVSLQDVLQKTRVPNLWLLTCGPTPPNPSELLGSQRMGELVTALTQVADVVLFDTPPALAVTDASLLARRTDGTLVVVRVGNTRQPALYQTLTEFQRVEVNVIGAVLNMLPPRSGLYYWYYYGHHYYMPYPNGDRGAKKKRLDILGWRRRR